MEPSDSADLWRLTLQYSPVGMALVGLDGRLLVANRALSEMLGLDAEELTRRGFQELTHPDDLDADLALFGAALAGARDSYRLVKRYLHADGRVVWGDLSVALARDTDGRPVHFVAQVLDVSEQREHEQRLQAARAEAEHEHQALEAVFDAVNVGLLLIDGEGRYERMNRRHEETMSLPFPDGHAGAAGQLGHVYHLDGKTLMTREEMPSYRANQGEEFDDCTYWVGDDPATRAAFSTSARQLRGPDGGRRGAVLAYQEITPLVRAMQAKDDFVSSVSHELRTPLTAVLGHLEMLGEREDLPFGVAEQLAVVQRNAGRLHTLVTDLLHAAEARAGAVRLQRSEVDLSEVVREAVEAARPYAERRGLAVGCEVPDRLVATVDGGRLRQVLDNLVSNGLKYGRPSGSVVVRLRREDASAVIEVVDDGIGIAADEIEHVFSRFFRGDRVVARHIPGTGLGLDIVGSIVAAHGGAVTVESEAGRGTTFRVTLPLGAGVPHSPPSAVTASSRAE